MVIMQKLEQFRKSCRGNVSILFACAAFGLLVAVGIGIDYARLVKARGELQAAADAAALAAGADSRTSADAIKTQAEKFLQANHSDSIVDTLSSADVSVDATTHATNVTLHGTLKTTFMSLAGFQTMDVDAYAQAIGGAGSAPIELALALDTTGSMAGSKLDTLKVAAKLLVSQVLAGSSDSKVGIVPFSTAVNVGVSHRGESWLNVPPDEHLPPTCYDSYPNPSGCTNTPETCYNDGMPYTCYNMICTDWGPPVKACYGAYTRKWWGCVMSRPEPYNSSVGSPEQPYYGPLDYSCGSALTDMTNSSNDLKNAVDGLMAGGETYIPDGILWAWNLLDPGVPFSNAMSYSDIAAKGGKKALVVMTDGYNTQGVDPNAVSNPNGVRWTCYPNCGASDALMTKICDNVKSAGIVVYTVAFDVTDANIQNLLQQCASDPGKAFIAADEAGLLASFGKIGKSLGNLRLAR